MVYKEIDNKAFNEYAMVNLRKLDWDTQHFGFNCYLLENPAGYCDHIYELLEDIYHCKDGLLTLKIDNPILDDDTIPDMYGCIEDVTLFRKLIPEGFKARNLHSQYEFHSNDYRDEWIKDIQNMSMELYTYTRFFKDPKFDIGKAMGVYSEWIINAVLDNHTHIDVITHNGKVAAFHIWKDSRTSLIGVKSKYRRLNLATILLEKAWELPYINHWVYGTQSHNNPAIQMVHRLEFEDLYTTTVFHCWNI